MKNDFLDFNIFIIRFLGRFDSRDFYVDGGRLCVSIDISAICESLKFEINTEKAFTSQGRCLSFTKNLCPRFCWGWLLAWKVSVIIPVESVEIIHSVVRLFEWFWLFCWLIQPFCDWFEKLFSRKLAKPLVDSFHFEFMPNLFFFLLLFELFFRQLPPLLHWHDNYGAEIGNMKTKITIPYFQPQARAPLHARWCFPDAYLRPE